LTLIQPQWKTAYAQSWFLGLQQQVTPTWVLEANALGSLGRRLVTTDIVNRPFSVPASQAGRDNPGRYLNPQLPEIAYRGTQGSSNYLALALLTRWRARAGQFQLAYTWGHSIDNQSEPLAGEFFDLQFTRPAAASVRARAAFTRQFDSHGDRANSDFDQRHNLVFFSVWDLPRVGRGSRIGPLLSNWKFSQMAAFRSGFPYTVFATGAPPAVGGAIVNNRADLLSPNYVAAEPAPGGRVLLSREAFREPPAGGSGDSGRNAFRGPGQFNIDVSLARSFALRRLGDPGKLTLRADVFNFLNHANLNPPDPFIGSPTFGVALYGRRAVATLASPRSRPFRRLLVKCS
jgi:hypothetical protein